MKRIAALLTLMACVHRTVSDGQACDNTYRNMANQVSGFGDKESNAAKLVYSVNMDLNCHMDAVLKISHMVSRIAHKIVKIQKQVTENLSATCGASGGLSPSSLNPLNWYPTKSPGGYLYPTSRGQGKGTVEVIDTDDNDKPLSGGIRPFANKH